MNEIFTYLAIPVLLYFGFKGILSFIKDDGKEHFQQVQDTAADSWTVKKTIGRKNYIRLQNLIWGIICLVTGFAILIYVINGE